MCHLIDKWYVYVYRFHLYKENKDTQEALGLIGKMLGVQVFPHLLPSLNGVFISSRYTLLDKLRS